MCKPYLTARSYITPYLEPYYDNYAAPYVDAARPYVEKIDKQIYRPTAKFGRHSYELYGAPHVDQAWEYGQLQWEKSLKPQIDAAQTQARRNYDRSLAPHVTKLSTAFAPYYRISQDTVLRVYHDYIIPAYAVSRPYIEKAYTLGHKVAIETGLPYTQWALGSTKEFVNRTLWPKLRILYGKNVEPQLVRISERLGRYRDGKKLKAAVEEIDR